MNFEDYIGKFVIVANDKESSFFGYLKSIEGKTVILKNARRIYYWEGAFTLSQMAIDGVKFPDKCQFAGPVEEIIFLDSVSVILVSDKAKESLESVEIFEV